MKKKTVPETETVTNSTYDNKKSIGSLGKFFPKPNNSLESVPQEKLKPVNYRSTPSCLLFGIDTNIEVVEAMLEYCQQASETIDYFVEHDCPDMKYELSMNFILQNATTQCVIAINNLSKLFTKDFAAKNETATVNFSIITRHAVDLEKLANTLVNEMPKLKEALATISDSHKLLTTRVERQNVSASCEIPEAFSAFRSSVNPL